MENQQFTPKIVGFLCNWCTYAAADSAGVARLKMPPSVMVVRVMCSGRVNPLFVLTAFLRGADGVLISGCWPGQCHYQRGNLHARRRVAMLKSILDTLELDMADRFRLSWISASEAPRFEHTVHEFTENIKQLGPSPIGDELFV
ncbi:MAG: hydrogenase iron-sulfur subunit [Thermoflexales bacterium]|nr:hydrogenase iron-sulfur subunit [Thermoflexales bacterium]